MKVYTDVCNINLSVRSVREESQRKEDEGSTRHESLATDPSYRTSALRTIIAPHTTLANTASPGTAPLAIPAALVLPLLVLPSCIVSPECPLLVASTDGLIVAVFCFLVYAVVGNVAVTEGFDSAKAVSVR